MTKHKLTRKGKQVVTRKPHGHFVVREREVIQGEVIWREYIVADFTSKSL